MPLSNFCLTRRKKRLFNSFKAIQKLFAALLVIDLWLPIKRKREILGREK
jgi:hypothetical protein